MILVYIFLEWKRKLILNGFTKHCTKKMLLKFLFGDSIPKDLGMINPETTCTYTYSTIESLAKQFPQFGLSDSESLVNMRE